MKTRPEKIWPDSSREKKMSKRKREQKIEGVVVLMINLESFEPKTKKRKMDRKEVVQTEPTLNGEQEEDDGYESELFDEEDRIEARIQKQLYYDEDIEQCKCCGDFECRFNLVRHNLDILIKDLEKKLV